MSIRIFSAKITKIGQVSFKVKILICKIKSHGMEALETKAYYEMERKDLLSKLIIINVAKKRGLIFQILK